MSNQDDSTNINKTMVRCIYNHASKERMFFIKPRNHAWTAEDLAILFTEIGEIHNKLDKLFTKIG